jgi:hypothetical protein
MKKVISFSLWGDKPMYNVGAIRNAEMAKEIYPGFECWFYIHAESVPNETIEKLKLFDNAKIILKSGDLLSCKPMAWRFEAIDDPEVEIMMSRDTDTRFTLREKLAVEEWLNSDRIFHILRDHPHHDFEILGGMFGTKKLPEIQSWYSLIEKIDQNNIDRWYDQVFLKDFIYPIIKDNSMIHARFHKKESHCRDFPIDYSSDLRFVGEYVFEDESRSQYHIDELRGHL